MIEKRLAGLFVVAFPVVMGDEAVVAEEQVHTRPVQAVLTKPVEKSDTGTAAGEHDQCLAPRLDCR